MATVPKDREYIDTQKLAKEALLEIEEAEREVKILTRFIIQRKKDYKKLKNNTD